MVSPPLGEDSWMHAQKAEFQAQEALSERHLVSLEVSMLGASNILLNHKKSVNA